MELTSSALTGALRVGVQVIVAQKRPVLEIYQEVHNDFDPPFDIEHRDSTNTKVVRTEQHRFQHIFIALTLVNIGSERAENINFEVTGAFRRDEPFVDWPNVFKITVRQFAPGQSLHLFQIRDHDLLTYKWEGEGNHRVGKPDGTKTDTFTITAHYDGPNTWLNRLARWHRRWLGLKQFSSEFTFDPALFHELPPPKYNG